MDLKSFGPYGSIISLTNLFFLSSCSDFSSVQGRATKEIKSEVVAAISSDARPYLVRDSSLHKRPIWLDNLKDWIKYETAPVDLEEGKFFTYESGPKINRVEACDIAKSNVRYDISETLAALLSKNLLTDAILNKSPIANVSAEEKAADLSVLKDFLESKLAEKMQPQLKGTQLVKSYWEYREYKKEMGAEENFKAYACGVLVRVANENLKKALIFGQAQIRSHTFFIKYKIDLQEILSTNEKNSLVSLGLE